MGAYPSAEKTPCPVFPTTTDCQKTPYRRKWYVTAFRVFHRLTSMSEPTTVSPGSQIGPYQVVRLLGEGGMGAVFEAVHQAIGRKVAIKVLHPEFARNKEITTRFFNEARAVNIVDHPGLVQISDYGQLSDGTTYIVMELLKGESLARRMHAGDGKATLPLAEILQLSWQIADSLVAAHEKGIIHRDLKPENVMIIGDSHMASGERTKIVDFGLAKLAEGNSGALAKTKSNAVMGTPMYMSPEQCAGAGGVDAKTDVYALGCMLYEMLGGKPPFLAEGAGQILGMHMFKQPEPLQKLAPAVPTQITDFVHRLLDKEKARRPTMQQVAGQLEALAKLTPPPVRKVFGKDGPSDADLARSTRPASTLGQAAAQTGVLRRRLGLAGAVSLSLVGLTVSGIIAFRRDPSAPHQSALQRSDLSAPYAAMQPPPTPVASPQPAPAGQSKPEIAKPSQSVAHSSTRKPGRPDGQPGSKFPSTTSVAAPVRHERPKIEQ